MKCHLLPTAHRLEVEVLRASIKLACLKLSVLVSFDKGLTQEQTTDILGTSSCTVFNCKKKYDTVGLDQFLYRHYVPYIGRLSNVQFIDTRFVIEYSTAAVRIILRKLNFVYKKVLQVPGQLNAAEQEKYLEVLEPFLKEADPESEAIYFVDGLHPQHNTRADRACIKRGKEKKFQSNTGRNRMNIIDCVNFCGPSDWEIIEGDTVNGQMTQQLFKKLLEKHPDKKVYVLVDNARYNYNTELLEWNKGNPRLEILYLPLYSPNLNLAKRLWKFTRKKVINLRYYPTFDRFKVGTTTFSRIPDNIKRSLGLITPNFQRFLSNPRV
jgi:transposase